MEWYNGFSPAERAAKGKALNKAIKVGAIQPPSGPCALCGDSKVPVEYHSEDYSVPYQFAPPAIYALCRHCHRNKLHKRFDDPIRWEAFKAHVRRGGYASDLVADPIVKREFETYLRARKGGRPATLRPLRPYLGDVGEEWWERLATTPTA